MIGKFTNFVRLMFKRHASRGLRITMIEAICYHQKRHIEFAEAECRGAMRDWALRWRETRDDADLLNALRFKMSSNTLRQILEVME